MDTKNKGPIVEAALCRCCRSIKRCRILTSEYNWMEKTELYSDLIVECFGLVLSHLDGDPKDLGICATCVSRLREAHSFRWQVVQAQEAFVRARHELDLQIDHKEKFQVNVKIEDNLTSDDGSDGMDAFDSADDMPLKTSTKITNIPKKKTKTDVKEINKELKERVEKMHKKLSRKLGQEQKPVAPKHNMTKAPKPTPDQEHMAHSNVVTIVNCSYVCPFHTRVSNYYCYYCKEQFTDPSELRTHTLTHSPTEFEGMMENRKIPKIDITRIDCRLCDAKIDDLQTLKSHITSIHKKVIHPIENEFLKFKLTLTNLKCTECDHNFPYFDALKKHMNEHFGTLVCDICGACFLEPNSLISHIRSHKRCETNFPCEVCGKNLKSKYSRGKHIATVHEKIATVNCYKCEDSFLSHALRNRHLIEVHGDKRTFPCKLCDKVYNRRKSLMEHNRRTHLKVYRHQCNLCDQRFFIPSRLKEHLATHTGERSYRCEICDKSYPRHYSLQEHIRTHSSDRKHKCNVCDSTFAQCGALKAHIKTHQPGFVEGFS